MKAVWSDRLRVTHKVYLEPVLITACRHQACKGDQRTVSRYCRQKVIEGLMRDGYPLDRVAPRIVNELRRAVTP